MISCSFSTQLIKSDFSTNRSSHRRCSLKKGAPRNFGKVTGKHLCQGLFFNKVAGQACIFIKKETLAQVFSCEFHRKAPVLLPLFIMDVFL